MVSACVVVCVVGQEEELQRGPDDLVGEPPVALVVEVVEVGEEEGRVVGEGGARGVTSNCVNPGYVRTPLVEKQIADQAAAHGIDEHQVLEQVMLTESAIKRLVEPSEVASLVGWLASSDAGMVTGASYTMDGGWSAR